MIYYHTIMTRLLVTPCNGTYSSGMMTFFSTLYPLYKGSSPESEALSNSIVGMPRPISPPFRLIWDLQYMNLELFRRIRPLYHPKIPLQTPNRADIRLPPFYVDSKFEGCVCGSLGVMGLIVGLNSAEALRGCLRWPSSSKESIREVKKRPRQYRFI